MRETHVSVGHAPCRESFSATSRILGNIVGSLQQGGWDCEWDINNVLMRFAMDMTSFVVSD